MIGSTDTHTGSRPPRRGQLLRQGRLARADAPEPLRRGDQRSPDGDPQLSISTGWQTSASGLAAVWARENTREALCDAMTRKEVYATTGTRMLVRVFAGWDFTADDVDAPDFAEQGYAQRRADGRRPRRPHRPARRRRSWSGRCATPTAPTSTASRSSRAGSTRTARRTSRSTTSPVRRPQDRRRRHAARPVGNTVDVPNATYTNTIGAPTARARTGRTRTSTRSSAPSTTCG